MPRGGKREGAGRHTTDTPAKSRCFRMTDAKWEELQRRAKAGGMTITEYITERTTGGD